MNIYYFYIITLILLCQSQVENIVLYNIIISALLLTAYMLNIYIVHILVFFPDFLYKIFINEKKLVL